MNVNKDKVLPIASFLAGYLAYVETSSEKELKNDEVLLSWMGCGASDRLTYELIKDFVKEINAANSNL